MDALRRNQYLQTMGVDVWVSRRSAAAPASAAEDLGVEAGAGLHRAATAESAGEISMRRRMRWR